MDFSAVNRVIPAQAVFRAQTVVRAQPVIPAQAGIHRCAHPVDPGVRRDDGCKPSSGRNLSSRRKPGSIAARTQWIPAYAGMTAFVAMTTHAAMTVHAVMTASKAEIRESQHD
jgi:hypothetical protein